MYTPELSVLLITALFLKPVMPQPGDPCYNTCLPYNDVLDSCLHDDDNNTDYNFCVCNDDDFAVTNAACVACTGVDSAVCQIGFQTLLLRVIIMSCMLACFIKEVSQRLFGLSSRRVYTEPRN